MSKKSEAAALLGKLGGKATRDKHGKEYYARIAKLGAAKAGRPRLPENEIKPESLKRREYRDSLKRTA